MIKFLRISSLMVASVLLSACWGEQTWRQQMTVTVSTPSGDISGSSVVEVSVHENLLFKDGARHKYTIRGEAVSVDLGSDRYLFALLSSEADREYIARLLPSLLSDEQYQFSQTTIDRAAVIRGRYAVPEHRYPMFVTFSDLVDPETVSQVHGGNFTTTFGDDYSIKSVTIQVGSELELQGGLPPALLRWIYPLGDRLCTPSFGADATLRFCELVSRSDFKRE